MKIFKYVLKCVNQKRDYQLVWKEIKDGVREPQTNELSKEIVHTTSIDLFKNKLDEVRK